MAEISSTPRFFGIDLSTLWQDLRSPWATMRQWPVLRWLTPVVPVRLVEEDGRHTFWVSGATSTREAAKPATASFLAVQLPEDRVLRRSLTVPAMSNAEVANAVALEVRSTSPFAAGDVVWGYVATRQRTVVRLEVAMASRKQTEQYLQQWAQQGEMRDTPEVWVLSAAREPIVMAGFGENRRAATVDRWRRVGGWLLLLATVLLAALAVTPTVQLRMRALEAADAFASVVQRAAPLSQKREAVVKSSEGLAALNDIIASRVDPLRVMELLTQALPDNTTLLSLRIQGFNVYITGQTDNTAVLMTALGNYPGLRDVKAPSAATKPLGAAKESFSIELTLDPKAIGATAASGAAPTAASTSISAPQTPAVATAAPAVPSVTSAPPGSSGPQAPATGTAAAVGAATIATPVLAPATAVSRPPTAASPTRMTASAIMAATAPAAPASAAIPAVPATKAQP